MNYTELQHEIQDNLPIPDREELWEGLQNGDLTKYSLKQIEEGMLQKKDINDTLYHWACRDGKLGNVPYKLLTANNLLKHDKIGLTCLHWASWNGRLKKLPVIPYKELKALQTYFEKDTSNSKEDILAALKSQIAKHETIQQSLKQDHQKIQ
jgi:hypothetical protein